VSLEHSPPRAGVKVLRRQQVLDRLGISPATLHAWVAAGSFPKPIKLGANTSAWLEDEVDGFIAQCAAARDRGQQPRASRHRRRLSSAEAGG
jgi:prophage regulatory protein